MYAYIDESGDFGYSIKSSRYFIVTCFIISEDNISNLEKDLKKYLGKLIKTNKKRLHYFHAYKESEKTKKDLLKIINKYEYKIIYFVLDKSKTKYDYKNFIIKTISKLEGGIKNIYISKYETRKSVNEEIRNYFPSKDIIIKLTSQDILLQVSDLFSWIIFQKEEKGSDDFYKMCKNFTKQNP